jgi:DNA-binding response OmpR family regulator
MNKPRLLLIDDSEDIHLLVRKILNDTAEIIGAYSWSDGKNTFEQNHFDIVIIDLMLGDQDGMELLREFKLHPGMTAKTRFFILTAKDSQADEIMGHTQGVDEYIKKPFDPAVLKAIIKKNLKILTEINHGEMSYPPLVIDNFSHLAFIENGGERKTLSLTAKEFKLLSKFVAHPEKAFSREELFTQVWSGESDSTFRTIDMHVSSLRKKLGDHSDLIVTVHQVGYKLSKS